MSRPVVTSTMEESGKFIQILRGIAVLLVVYYHFSDRVPPKYLGMDQPPSLVFHSGKIGVLIFFAMQYPVRDLIAIGYLTKYKRLSA